jgi:CHAT domain-containing protein
VTPDVSTALQLFTLAKKELGARNMDAAAQSFSTASTVLRHIQSPLAIQAAIYAASSTYYRGESATALALLGQLERDYEHELAIYPSLAAEVSWTRGLIFYRLGRPNDSLDAYRRAQNAARTSRETEAEVALSSLISGLLDIIGDPAEADRFRAEVLRKLSAIGGAPQRMYVAYSQATYAELRAQRPRVALAFIRAQSPIAADEQKRSGDTLLLAETELQRGLALSGVGRLASALAALASARGYVAGVKTPALRDRVGSDIDYVSGVLLKKSDPRRARTALDAALTTWEHYAWKNRSSYGRLARGEVCIALGDRDAAEQDFRAGIHTMEEQRQQIDEPALRVAYFERAERLFTQLEQLLIEDHRTTDALDVAERKRARELLDRITSAEQPSARGISPLAAADIVAGMPPSAALVEYSLTDYGIAAWVVRNGDTRFSFSSIAPAALESNVVQLANAIAADHRQAIDLESRRLFDSLIAPVEHHLDGVSTLIIVPDGFLNTVPFACLIGPDGRYLIERTPLIVSPSASLFVRGHPHRANGARLLAVAQPAPSPDLPFLQNATSEVTAIARDYRHAEIYFGNEVTPFKFMQLAGSADIVHFAGHATNDLRSPGKSALLFEGAPGNEVSRLTAASISAGRLPSSPLIILAACQTGNGRVWRNEGLDSIAAAFLHAGASGVIANLWDIEDNAASHLFEAYHDALQREHSASAALRTALIAAMHSADENDRRPASWAGVRYIGSM